MRRKIINRVQRRLEDLPDGLVERLEVLGLSELDELFDRVFEAQDAAAMRGVLRVLRL